MKHNIIRTVEEYLDDYICFADRTYRLPVALWIIATHMFEDFDSFPYLVITSATKQAGKTRLAELCSFACNNPLMTTGATAASIFYKFDISERDREKGITPPTVFMDEAEKLSSSTDLSMRAFLNGGYRKGSVVPRVGRDFPSYSPKCFILIGDVYDTLRDRSIIVVMKRGEPKKRFLWTAVQDVGSAVREWITAALEASRPAIKKNYQGHPGLTFLPDRDEEIWLPLFAICQALSPDRVEELSRAAVDIATEKTAPLRRYVNLAEEEDKALDDQFAKRLLIDMYSIFDGKKNLATTDIINQLVELPTAPWRRFRGVGLTPFDIGNLLSRFGLKAKAVQLGSRRTGTRQIVKGFTLKDLTSAIHNHKILVPEEARHIK